MLKASDGMLMGRGTYEYLAAGTPQTGPYTDAINAIRKYVFSQTLERADWNNSTDPIRVSLSTARPWPAARGNGRIPTLNLLDATPLSTGWLSSPTSQR